MVHVLILGAAGMIGRKLTARLVADGNLGGGAIERLTLADVITPQQPAGRRWSDRIGGHGSRCAGRGRAAGGGSARCDLPSGGGGVG